MWHHTPPSPSPCAASLLLAAFLALTAAAAGSVAAAPVGAAATATGGGRRMLLQSYSNGGGSSGSSRSTDGEGGGGLQQQADPSSPPPPPPPAPPSAVSLPPLPYSYDALEPVISSQIMRLHHDTHEGGYAARTGDLVAQLPPDRRNVTQLLTQVGSGFLPAAQETTLRNQGGGLWNHELFWKVMASPGSAPTSRANISPGLQSAIDAAFGSVDAMLARLKASADAVFGSGWAWVCVPTGGGRGGRLQLLATANQDNPLMQVVIKEPCAPILGLDVWEHAYYLQYQAKRADYTKAWQQLINWSAVSSFYAAATTGDLSYNI